VFQRLIEDNETVVAAMESALSSAEPPNLDADSFLTFHDTLDAALRSEGLSCSQLWALGPRKARANALFNRVAGYATRPGLFAQVAGRLGEAAGKSIQERFPMNTMAALRDLDQSVVQGFKLFCRAGPLCAEIVRGLAVLVEEWRQEDAGGVTEVKLVVLLQYLKVINYRKLN